MNEKRSVSTYKWKRRYVSRSEKCSVYGVDHELVDQCIRPTDQYSEEVSGKNQDKINQKKARLRSYTYPWKSPFPVCRNQHIEEVIMMSGIAAMRANGNATLH